jgi:lipopolysaccharide cholinephosphotransferase
MMKRAWAASMEVLAEVDRICKEYGIRYFADWGTLLGAVRHKGFIPWDDDLDIAMLRPDYQKFLRVAPKAFRPPFRLMNIYTNDDWDNMLTRVLGSLRIHLDEEYLEQFHGFPYPVGIDIFPLDYVSRNPEEDAMQMEMIQKISQVSDLMDNYKDYDVPLEDAMHLVDEVEKMCAVKLDHEKPLGSQLRILVDRLCAIYGDEDADEVCMPVKRLTNRPNYHMPKAYFADSIDMPFENITIPVPVGYDEWLKLKYGDYMKPVQNDAGHDYPFYERYEKILEAYLREAQANDQV